jgi:predicted dehydrogenase
MSKHNVYNQEARRLAHAGAIGSPLAMTATRLGWRKYDWRSRPQESGLGCLADLGIYPVLTGIDIFGCEPERYTASAWPIGDPDRTDVYTEATLWFDERRYLHFDVSACFNEQPASAELSMYTVVGDEGILQVSGSWAMDGRGSVNLCGAQGWRTVELVPVDPYASQYRLLAECAAGAPVPAGVSLARAQADLEILHAVADAAFQLSAARSASTAAR